jgi:hypothetical protein
VLNLLFQSFLQCTSLDLYFNYIDYLYIVWTYCPRLNHCHFKNLYPNLVYFILFHLALHLRYSSLAFTLFIIFQSVYLSPIACGSWRRGACRPG